MSKIVVYHGSFCKIEKPEIIEGRFHKDFGEGFYCTIIKNQAVRWSKKYETPIVNVYEYNENSQLKTREFSVMSEEWLDFIIACRNGKKHDYDIVIGAMADDQIYNYITDLINDVITREAFWELAKFKYPTHQIAFCTEKALQSLKFMKEEIVDE